MFCILESFSFVTGLPKELFTEIIGHDGKEIVRPGMAIPYCYRSFTPSEMSLALLFLGIRYVRIDYPDYEKIKNLSQYDLIAFKGRHCIALKNEIIFDTQNKIITLDQFLPCSSVTIF